MGLETKAKTSYEIIVYSKCFVDVDEKYEKEFADKSWVPLEEAQKEIEKWSQQQKDDYATYLDKVQKLESDNKYLTEVNEGLEKIAFENSLKVDNANKILDDFPRISIPPDERELIKKTLQRLREVLK